MLKNAQVPVEEGSWNIYHFVQNDPILACQACLN